MDPTQEISIPLGEWKRLCAAEDKLSALEAAGVDNWPGYSDAMAMLDDETEEEPS